MKTARCVPVALGLSNLRGPLSRRADSIADGESQIGAKPAIGEAGRIGNRCRAWSDGPQCIIGWLRTARPESSGPPVLTA